MNLKASWELRQCPECFQALPAHWDWDVRSLAWLHDQPRNISPSNNDLTIHDGHNGRNRFLHMELKLDNRELSNGQRRQLEGLARYEMFTVLVVRGKVVNRITVQQITSRGWLDAVETTCESLNSAIASFLGGSLWRDASSALSAKAKRSYVPAGRPGHTCGWARFEDIWRCVQDYYASGSNPESGCGLEIPA